MNRGKFTLKGDDIQRIFEPVMKEIISLVQGQIDATGKAVKAVLLVGGFGESAYLLQSLRRALGSEIEVLVPPNRYGSLMPINWLRKCTKTISWTAVVRGALMKGLSQYDASTARVRVDSRLARKNYGIHLAH